MLERNILRDVAQPVIKKLPTYQAEELTQGKEVFALKVKGLSMTDALIDDGDTVLIEPVNQAN